MNQAFKKFRGIIPPLATPLLDQHTLDEAGLSHLLRHVLDGGVHGLFILGTTSEALSLSYRLRHQLMEQVIAEVGGQMPVLVGITDTSLEEAQLFARQAQHLGADAVVVAPPFYYPASQESLKAFVNQLLGTIDLPLFLYNIPSHSPHAFSQDTILQLMAHPQLAGYKDSTGNMKAFHHLSSKMSEFPEKSYLLGPEELLLESMLLGADGAVSAGANIFPQLYVRLYEAAREGELNLARKLHHQVIQVSHALYQEGKTVIEGVKYALAFQGICKDSLALPLSPLSKEEKSDMRLFLESFDPDYD